MNDDREARGRALLEQRFHFAAARRLGVPRAKLVAMITHTAHYAGWPNAVGALRSLREVWPEDAVD